MQWLHKKSVLWSSYSEKKKLYTYVQKFIKANKAKCLKKEIPQDGKECLQNIQWIDILLSLIHCVLDVYSKKTNCAELIPFISIKIQSTINTVFP